MPDAKSHLIPVRRKYKAVNMPLIMSHRVGNEVGEASTRSDRGHTANRFVESKGEKSELGLPFRVDGHLIQTTSRRSSGNSE